MINQKRNYTIMNFMCDRTYPQVVNAPITTLNEKVASNAVLTLMKHYGETSPYKSSLNSTIRLYDYMFIAWLSNDNEEDLFIIGDTKDPQSCVSDIYRMGDESYDKFFNY